MSKTEIETKVQELRELRRMAAELEDAINGIQDSIKEEMTAQNVDTLSGTDWKATWKEVKSARLDTAAIKKALPEIAERFTKTTTTRRFVLA